MLFTFHFYCSSAIDLGGEELFISVLEPKPVLDPACSLQNDGALLGSITELKEGQQYKGCFNGTIQVKVFFCYLPSKNSC